MAHPAPIPAPNPGVNKLEEVEAVVANVELVPTSAEWIALWASATCETLSGRSDKFVNKSINVVMSISFQFGIKNNCKRNGL